MTAVTALPNLHLRPLEYLGGLDILEESTITLLVTLLDGSYAAELGGKLMEAFLVGSLCESVIHVGPLVVLACCSCGKVLGGITYALEFLEPELCVLLLIVSCLKEESRNLLVAFLLGLGCEISVLVASLRLTGESRFQIFLGLGTCVFVCHSINKFVSVNTANIEIFSQYSIFYRL